MGMASKIEPRHEETYKEFKSVKIRRIIAWFLRKLERSAYRGGSPARSPAIAPPIKGDTADPSLPDTIKCGICGGNHFEFECPYK